MELNGERLEVEDEAELVLQVLDLVVDVLRRCLDRRELNLEETLVIQRKIKGLGKR